MQYNKRVKIILTILLLVAVVGLFWYMFSGDNAAIIKSLINDDLTEEEYKELLRSFGIRGSVTLGILSMLQVVIAFMPAEPVQVLLGVGYGFGQGVLIGLAGVVVGNTVIYILYKIFGDKLAAYFQKNIDVDFEKIHSSNVVSLIILILYFLPAIPYGLICFFTASLGVRYPKYIFLTAVGSVPSIMIGVGMGHLAIATSWVLSVIVFVVLVVLLVTVTIKRKAVFAAFNRYIGKMQKKDVYVVQKANPFVYATCLVGVKAYARKVKCVNQAHVEVDGPCIVLCSHGSFIDFVYSGLLLRKKKPHYVVARYYFYHKWLHKLLRALGAFPKSMFATDMENLKNCLRVLADGGVLTMMPEARLSTVGKFEGIQDSTIKFVKKMKVPVYGIRLNGSYFADPKWGDKLRKGSVIECDLQRIATVEELEALSHEELSARIEKVISYDDFAWLDRHPEYRYKSKTLAVGLENVLYKCPACGKEFTMKTKGMQIFCTECGMSATLTDRYAFEGGLPFANFMEWYEYQSTVLQEEIENTPDYVLQDKVTLKLSSKDGKGFVQTAGEGVCTLTKNGLCYEGTLNGELVKKDFPMNGIYRLLFGAGVDFEIYKDKEIYFFVPEDTRSCVKWYIASGILKTVSEKVTENLH